MQWNKNFHIIFVLPQKGQKRRQKKLAVPGILRKYWCIKTPWTWGYIYVKMIVRETRSSGRGLRGRILLIGEGGRVLYLGGGGRILPLRRRRILSLGWILFSPGGMIPFHGGGGRIFFIGRGERNLFICGGGRILCIKVEGGSFSLEGKGRILYNGGEGKDPLSCLSLGSERGTFSLN